MLHPDIGDITDGNDGSCVVEVTVGAARVLLTGDIESRGERRLAERGYLKRTELVFVPHHGSSTSSTAAFVAELQPQFAVVAAGYGNRWGFPKEDVINRCRRRVRQSPIPPCKEHCSDWFVRGAA
ncbi:MAG: hypothetical protein U5K38_05400 [Woeseiaceae bacterium]|nr:hypothetical protein [Woeseiaceae bacterium]